MCIFSDAFHWANYPFLLKLLNMICWVHFWITKKNCKVCCKKCAVTPVTKWLVLILCVMLYNRTFMHINLNALQWRRCKPLHEPILSSWLTSSPFEIKCGQSLVESGIFLALGRAVPPPPRSGLGAWDGRPGRGAHTGLLLHGVVCGSVRWRRRRAAADRPLGSDLAVCGCTAAVDGRCMGRPQESGFVSVATFWVHWTVVWTKWQNSSALQIANRHCNTHCNVHFFILHSE